MPANFNNADFDQAYTLSKAWVDAMQAFCADLDAVGTVLDPFGSAKLSENLRTAAKAARAAFPGMEYGQACLIVAAGATGAAKAAGIAAHRQSA